jgi:hypothetical protein
VQERREQMAERLRIAEHARDLLTELERRLKEKTARNRSLSSRNLTSWHSPCPRPTACGGISNPPPGPRGLAGQGRHGGEPVPVRRGGGDLDAPRNPPPRGHLSPGGKARLVDRDVAPFFPELALLKN